MGLPGWPSWEGGPSRWLRRASGLETGFFPTTLLAVAGEAESVATICWLLRAQGHGRGNVWGPNHAAVCGHTKGHRAHVAHTTGCPQGWRPQDHGPTLAEGGQSAMVGRLGLPRTAVTPTPRSPKPRWCWVLLNRFATEGTAEHLLHDGHVPFPRGSSPGSSDQPAGKRSFSRDRVSAAAASSGLPWKTSPMPSASRARWSPSSFRVCQQHPPRPPVPPLSKTSFWFPGHRNHTTKHASGPSGSGHSPRPCLVRAFP